MALDLRNNRASAIGKDLIFARVYPNPDGMLATMTDRLHMSFNYNFGVSGPTPAHAYQHQQIDTGIIGYRRSWNN